MLTLVRGVRQYPHLFRPGLKPVLTVGDREDCSGRVVGALVSSTAIRTANLRTGVFIIGVVASRYILEGSWQC